jgi:hypothetical protein
MPHPRFGNRMNSGGGGLGHHDKSSHFQGTNGQTFNSPSSTAAQVDVMTVSNLLGVAAYCILLFFVTFAVTLARKRLLTFMKLPSILFYISYYLMNLFVIKSLFGYHYLFQLVSSAAMGIILVKFKDLNVLGLTGNIEF